MAKHPSSFKLTDSEGDLSAITEPKVIHEGSVRQLCPLAPNNVIIKFNMKFKKKIENKIPTFFYWFVKPLVWPRHTGEHNGGSGCSGQ